MRSTNLRADNKGDEKVSFRVDIDNNVRAAIMRMAGGRRQAQFIEDVIPVIAMEFEKVLQGKAEPFDPMTRALLPYVELYRQRGGALEDNEIRPE